jgi:hypothetical protein
MNTCKSIYILQIIALILVIGWFAAYTTGPNINAKWMLIDDHSIAMVLGPDRKFTLAEFIPELLKTELGKPFYSSRYRPALWSLILTETYLWGDDPGLWYLCRTVLWGVCLLGIALSAWMLIGYIGAYAITAWIACIDLWWAIWERLGAAEIYAAGGLGLYLPSIVYLWRVHNEKSSKLLSHIAFFFFVIGNFFLMGAKENWLALLLPNALFTFFYLRRFPKDYVAWPSRYAGKPLSTVPVLLQH